MNARSSGGTDAGSRGELRDFEGLHVVVTGGTGALGGAVVERLSRSGATCHVPSRSRDKEGKGERVRVVGGVDLTDDASVRGFYERLPALWASVHCAGGFAMGPIDSISATEFDRLIAMNARSAFLCCREAVRRMRADGVAGRIVNVAAQPGIEPRRGASMTAYAASKAAVAALTEALAEEVAPEGIWVNAVAPSILDTAANRAAMPDADASRWPSVEQVAAAIAFLASPANAAARGTIVRVYGRA